jgi:toxin ParE1/3/4
MDTSPYEVDVMPRVESDIDGIYEYIANVFQAPDTAQKMVQRIDAAIDHLGENPHLYSKSYNEVLAAKGYHRVLVGHYGIFFLIDDEARRVLVMRVVYEGRDLEALL